MYALLACSECSQPQWLLEIHLLPMRSLKKLNAAAGTTYTRWKQVVLRLLRGEELGAAATPQTVPGSRPGSPEQGIGPRIERPTWTARLCNPRL